MLRANNCYWAFDVEFYDNTNLQITMCKLGLTDTFIIFINILQTEVSVGHIFIVLTINTQNGLTWLFVLIKSRETFVFQQSEKKQKFPSWIQKRVSSLFSLQADR